MAHYNIVIPVKAGEKTHYTRVGALFENVNRETNETYYKIMLDFAVAEKELLAFPPRPPEAQGAGRAAS